MVTIAIASGTIVDGIDPKIAIFGVSRSAVRGEREAADHEKFGVEVRQPIVEVAAADRGVHAIPSRTARLGLVAIAARSLEQACFALRDAGQSVSVRARNERPAVLQ